VDKGLRGVGDALEELTRLRNHADYDMAPGKKFTSATDAQNAIMIASSQIGELDHILTNPTRASAAAADIRAKWP
jgi:hypothetical protein